MRRAATRVAVLAAVVLGLALAGWRIDLPELRTATALALSLGLGAVLVARLDARPRLGWLWAEITVWIALAFVIASCWNALWTGVSPATGIDLGLAVVQLVPAFGLARATQRAHGSGPSGG
ncbi:MAG: hypothetical protein AB7O97_12505 [Planctomycetota bacterium]